MVNRIWPTALAEEADSVSSVSASACHIGGPNSVNPGQILLVYGNLQNMLLCGRTFEIKLRMPRKSVACIKKYLKTTNNWSSLRYLRKFLSRVVKEMIKLLLPCGRWVFQRPQEILLIPHNNVWYEGMINCLLKLVWWRVDGMFHCGGMCDDTTKGSTTKILNPHWDNLQNMLLRGREREEGDNIVHEIYLSWLTLCGLTTHSYGHLKQQQQ